MNSADDRQSLPSPASPPISPWLWLGLPFGYVVVEFTFRILNEATYRRMWDSELGPGESLTFLFLFTAAIFGLVSLWQSRTIPPPRLPAAYRVWLLLVTLGAIYMAGEESSWGQHWFGWQTPEQIAALNDQQETNLHNMSSWLDQKPRLAFEIWVLIAGLCYPVYAGIVAPRKDRVVRRALWFWPPRLVFPTALLAILAPLPERFGKWFGMPVTPPFDIRTSEQQEALFAIFLLLYLCSYWLRVQRVKRQEKLLQSL